MAPPLIGRTVRRLRQDKRIAQATLAKRLGISASYLNLIEHDQRGVTAALLIKLADVLGVEIGALSGNTERAMEAQLREVFADPMLGAENVPDAEAAALAGGSPAAARAILALYRAWHVAREDAGGIALPSGRRLLLPTEEARDFFNERANHFPALEQVAGAIAARLGAAPPSELNHAITERLRHAHGVTVRVGPAGGSLRRYDPAARLLLLSEALPRESRGFHRAFQLALLEAREAVEDEIRRAEASTTEAAGLIRIGLLNYIAAAVLMPYAAFAAAAEALRHDLDALAARFGVSFEQVCHRLASLQRGAERGVPFFFLRVDPAGNVTKRFTAAGFPFARFGGSCPRWVVHTALAAPGRTQVQVAQLPDGATFLCMARAVSPLTTSWGEPPPTHVVAIGCDIGHAGRVVYADGLDLQRAAVGIGLSCRLCERQECRSRAFPPLEHRLAMDPMTASASPYRFEVSRRRGG